MNFPEVSLKRASLKSEQLNSWKIQCTQWEEFFREYYPEIARRMRWNVNTIVLEKLQSMVFEGKPFFHLTVVPNLLEAFGKNQDLVSMDLRLASFYQRLSCQHGIQFSNDCIMGERVLFKEKDGYTPFYLICEEQGASLILLLVQYGHVHPYTNRGAPSPLMKREFHVTLGLEFMVMAMQKPQTIWELEPSRLIVSGGSMAEAGFDEQGGYSSFPCVEYYEDEKTIVVMPLKESLAWETDEGKRRAKEHNAGFMTAIV